MNRAVISFHYSVMSPIIFVKTSIKDHGQRNWPSFSAASKATPTIVRLLYSPWNLKLVLTPIWHSRLALCASYTLRPFQTQQNKLTESSESSSFCYSSIALLHNVTAHTPPQIRLESLVLSCGKVYVSQHCTPSSWWSNAFVLRKVKLL